MFGFFAALAADAEPTITSLPVGLPWMSSASLSRMSLQSLSTRAGKFGFCTNVHFPHGSGSTHGGGSFGTVTVTRQLALRLRSSFTVPVTVMVPPASLLLGVTVAESPLPETCPLDVVQA